VNLTPDQLHQIGQLSDQWSFLWDKRRSLWIAAEDCLGSLGEDALGAATTIVNAKVFDGTKLQDWTSVRFADGLITGCSVASAAREGDDVIDAGGGSRRARTI